MTAYKTSPDTKCTQHVLNEKVWLGLTVRNICSLERYFSEGRKEEEKKEHAAGETECCSLS